MLQLTDRFLMKLLLFFLLFFIQFLCFVYINVLTKLCLVVFLIPYQKLFELFIAYLYIVSSNLKYVTLISYVFNIMAEGEYEIICCEEEKVFTKKEQHHYISY